MQAYLASSPIPAMQRTAPADASESIIFDQLYLQYRAKVYRKCLAMLKKPVLAKDATQEIFIKVYLKLPQFRQESRFSTWLFAVTHNYCVDYLRKQERSSRHLQVDQELLTECPSFCADEDRGAKDRAVRELHQVLGRLSPEDNRILTMKFCDQLSIREIAGIINISEGAVKMRIKRAKARARSLRYRLAG